MNREKGTRVTIDTGWYKWAPCKDTLRGVPDSRKQAEEFINDFCSVCPVMFECRESALEADFFWGVIAGRIPERFLDDQVSSIPLSEGWKPKPPPEVASPGKTLLERGVCRKGLHGILSKEDIRKKTCRACLNFYATKEGQALKALERAQKEAAPKATASHCKNGHEKSEASGKIVTYLRNDCMVKYWSCFQCNAVNKVKGTLSEGAGYINRNKTHCKYGHEYTEENTYWQKTKTGLGRACKACRRVTEKGRLRSRAKNPKMVPPFPKAS